MKIQLITAEAKAGRAWMREGWRLFAQRPLPFLALTLLFVLGAPLLSAIQPIVGAVLVATAYQLLTWQFQRVSLGVAGPGRAAPLSASAWRRILVLGLVFAAAIFLVGALAYALTQSYANLHPWSEMLRHSSSGDSTAMLERMQDLLLSEPDAAMAPYWLMLWASVFYMPVSMAFWHAPALIALGDQSVPRSLFFSWLACVRNWRAFGAYTLGWSLVFAVGFSVLTLLVIVTRWLPLLWFSQPLLLVFFAAFMASVQASFDGCFSLSPAPSAQ